MKKLSKLKIRVVVLLSAFMAIFSGLNYAEDNYEGFPAQFNISALMEIMVLLSTGLSKMITVVIM